MYIGLGVNQLGVDPHQLARAADAAFQHITHTELAADLPGVDLLVLEGESGIARDDDHIGEPRQIGRQILCDPVRKILLVRIRCRDGQRAAPRSTTAVLWQAGRATERLLHSGPVDRQLFQRATHRPEPAA